MATSYMGKILRVDLGSKTSKVEDLCLDTARKFIGGRGLGTKLYMDEVDPMIDPLSPDNKIVIITGPLTGTAVTTGCRYMVVTKSPLTGMIACSNSGGKWGAALKYAGFDALILEGKADKPVYMNIVEDKVEILDAANLYIPKRQTGRQRTVPALPHIHHRQFRTPGARTDGRRYRIPFAGGYCQG